MRIGVDMDGVLNDIGAWHYSCGFKFCVENKIDRGFNPYKYMIEEQFGITDEENYKFWKEYIFDLMISIPTRPYAANVLTLLQEMGHEIVILTARDNRYLTNQYENTMNFYVEEWLTKNGIPYNQIIAGTGKKSEKVLCFDAPYNLDVKGDNIVRVYSWYQIYKYFIDLAKDVESQEKK